MRAAIKKLLARIGESQLGIVLLPWLLATANVLTLKYSLLSSGGFSESAVSIRRAGVLTLHEKLSLFRSDLGVCCLLVPPAVLVLTSLLPTRWKIAFTLMLSAFASIVVNLEVLVYNTTFAFTSLRVIGSVLLWALQSRDLAILSLSGSRCVEIAIWAVCLMLFAAIAWIASKRNICWLNRASLAILCLGGVMTAAASVPSVPAMAWTQSLLCRSVREAALVSNNATRLRASSVPELVRRYRKSANVPPQAPTIFEGKARNYNVVFFVLESMAAQAFDPAHDSLSDMPNFSKLREHSLLMGQHYTSYPFTNCAMFSIFTSVYTRIPLGIEIGDRGLKIPSLIRSLRDAGYQTGYYGYVWRNSLQRDDWMLHAIGFEKLFEPPTDPVRDPEGKTTFYGPPEYVEARDLMTLQAMESDIRQWTAERKKFVAAYFPELGHDPYRELPGHKSSEPIARGRALAVRHDAWMGELMAELKRDGVLDSTIIVVTGDHGMRTLQMESGLPVHLAASGKLEDVMMRVPMLIYVPNVVEHPTAVELPTSHIDIAPTLLDLMGVRGGRELEQGTPMTAPAVANRRLFLLMDKYGASGYYDQGTYYMRNNSRMCFKSSAMKFQDKDALPFGGIDAENVRKVLEEQDAVQNALLSHLLGRSSLPY